MLLSSQQWTYLGTPITVRMFMPISAVIIGRIGGYYASISCDQIAYAGATYSARPDSNASGKLAACHVDPTGWTAVKVNLYDLKAVTQAMAGLQMGFGMAGLLAFVVHSVAVEVFLDLTPAESERLRRVSWKGGWSEGWRRVRMLMLKLGSEEEMQLPMRRRQMPFSRGKHRPRHERKTNQDSSQTLTK